jgi:cob(I)alamin adenosyltransferase
MAKIYTKQGDAGETSLWGGVRVPKDDLRIRTYGTLDELNAVLGFALARESLSGDLAGDLDGWLKRVQGELFQVGAELATPRGKKMDIAFIGAGSVAALEQEIDLMEATLKPLKSFILPGGAPAAALLHLARTVCRRAERELVLLHRAEPVRAEVLQYVNRLGDYLFVCARYVNHVVGATDVPWISKTGST